MRKDEHVVVGGGRKRVVRLSVIGCGYLGAVHAAAMASIGHDVVGIDTDAEKIAALSRGEAPFFEPGLWDCSRKASLPGG